MSEHPAPQPPLVGERGINIGQDGDLTITHDLSLGYTPKDPDVTTITLTVEGAEAGGIPAHAEIETEGIWLQITFILDMSALDVLQAKVTDAYAAHRAHRDRQVTA